MSYLRIAAAVAVLAAAVTAPSALSERRLDEPRTARLVFALNGAQQGLYLLNAVSRRVRRLTHGADSEPRWSPDGRYIAFARDRPVAIWILDYKTGSIHRLAAGHSPVWSANGTTLYFICHFKFLCARQQPTAAHGSLTTYRLPFLVGELERVTNRQFILKTPGEALWMWSIGAKARQLTPGVLDLDEHPRVSPDRTTLLFTRLLEDGRDLIESIHLRNGKIQEVSHPGADHADDTASWIPKSNRIVFVRSVLHHSTVPTSTSNPVITIMTRDGHILRRLKAVQERVVDLDWRP